MSTNATPAPAPGPANPPDQNLPGGPAAGILSGLLTPVDPARATFDLTPTAPAADTTGAPDTTVAHGSSDAYHGDNNSTQNDGKKDAQTRQEKSVWKAWLLAGATRWARGGGVENKRLDLKKARASARQIKETRQVTMNRSGGTPSKGSNSPAGGASGGKNSSAKGGKKPAPKGPKNSNGNGPQGPSGGSSGNGAKGSGGSRGPGGGGASAAGKSGGQDSGSSKRDGAKPSPSGSQGSRKDGAAGSPGSAGKGGTGNGPAGTSPKGKTPGGSSGGKQPTVKDGANGKSGRQPDSQSGNAPGAGTGQQKDRKTPKKISLDKLKRTGKKNSTGANTTVKDSTAAKDSVAPDKASGETGKDTKGAPAAKGNPDSNKTDGKQKDSKPFTQAARETGYRDGSRAARAAAQGKAYVDGAKDGWTDTTEAAAREKERLDQVHQDRKNTRTKEQPVTTAATSADYHPPQTAQPIQVAGVTATHVLLGDNAGRDSLTRGEVRSLKSFERRLEAKKDVMAKVAEGTRGLKAHADQQVKTVTSLRERAKSVAGGEKLTAQLVKLEEAAKAQAAKAEEIHRRAVRATGGCIAVLTNAETRYGGMYKAVVDSDETAPAELAFYKG